MEKKPNVFLFPLFMDCLQFGGGYGTWHQECEKGLITFEATADGLLHVSTHVEAVSDMPLVKAESVTIPVPATLLDAIRMLVDSGVYDMERQPGQTDAEFLNYQILAHVPLYLDELQHYGEFEAGQSYKDHGWKAAWRDTYHPIQYNTHYLLTAAGFSYVGPHIESNGEYGGWFYERNGVFARPLWTGQIMFYAALRGEKIDTVQFKPQATTRQAAIDDLIRMGFYDDKRGEGEPEELFRKRMSMRINRLYLEQFNSLNFVN